MAQMHVLLVRSDWALLMFSPRSKVDKELIESTIEYEQPFSEYEVRDLGLIDTADIEFKNFKHYIKGVPALEYADQVRRDNG